MISFGKWIQIKNEVWGAGIEDWIMRATDYEIKNWLDTIPKTHIGDTFLKNIEKTVSPKAWQKIAKLTEVNPLTIAAKPL